jgi:hypothetical protein
LSITITICGGKKEERKKERKKERKEREIEHIWWGKMGWRFKKLQS